METWAGTKLGGFERLTSDQETMTQLQEDFMLTDELDAEGAGEAAATASAVNATEEMRATAADSAGTHNTSLPGRNAAMPDAQLDELYHTVKLSTAAAPELRHHLVSHLRQAQGTAQRLQASNDCCTAFANP